MSTSFWGRFGAYMAQDPAGRTEEMARGMGCGAPGASQAAAEQGAEHLLQLCDWIGESCGELWDDVCSSWDSLWSNLNYYSNISNYFNF